MTPDEIKALNEKYKGQRSTLILVIGMSGTGKTTSIELLPPAETCLINVMQKTLPFPDADEYVLGKNMIYTASPSEIEAEIKKYADYSYKPEVKNLIIDDCQYIMASEFMRRIRETGYEKWDAMAEGIWKILVLASRCRGGLKIYVLTHEEQVVANGRVTERKMKTLGQLLDSKLTPEGLSTITLFSGLQADANGTKYFFATQGDGVSCAKSPRGMFPPFIPNDLKAVSDRIDEYYGEKIKKWEDSKLKIDKLDVKRK